MANGIAMKTQEHLIPLWEDRPHPVETWKPGKRRAVLWVLSIGHFINDAYSAVLGAILPILILKYDLTLAAAGWLATIYAVSGALAQPVYGVLADKLRRRWFVVVGPAISAVFISCLTNAPGYAALAVFLLIAGSGSAMFHPQGAAYANRLSGSRKGLGMSFFITWGSIGFALGPALVIAEISWLGWENLYWAALPGIVYLFAAYHWLPNPEHGRRQVHSESLWTSIRPVWFPLLLLYVLVVLRSMVQMNMSAFLPTYFQGIGYSLEWANLIFTMFLCLGSAGGFFGGALADRLGHRNVILWSMAGAIPFLYGFLFTEGVLSVGLLLIYGTLVFATLPVNVVYAQTLAPKNASTVSALIMGFGWGVGGFTVPLCGRIGDEFGLAAALAAMGAVLAVGSLLGLFLPEEKR